MILNVTDFQVFLKKATLNWHIQSVHVKIKDGKVFSNMMSSDQNGVTMLAVPNTILPDLKEETDLYFADPNVQVKTYLDLFDEDEVHCEIHDNRMVLGSGKQESVIHFCSPDFVSTFGASEPDIEYFYQLPLDVTVFSMFKKAQKIAAKFGKMYFSVEKNKFYMEAVDKTNRFSNGVRFELDRVKHSDLESWYDFKYINAVLGIIGDNPGDFQANFAFLDEQNAGMIQFVNQAKSEKYFLMSRIEEDLG